MSIFTNVVSSNPAHEEVCSIQPYVIKYVSDLSVISLVTTVLMTNKVDQHDGTETLMKVVLNTTISPLLA